MWSSEEEVEESAEGGSDEESSDNFSIKNEDIKPKRSLRKRIIPESDKESVCAELPEELGKNTEFWNFSDTSPCLRFLTKLSLVPKKENF